MRKLWSFTVAAALLPGGLSAELELCNDGDIRQIVAIGYKSGDLWVSEGWWGIAPGACVSPIGDDLTHRYYYVAAEASGRVFVHDRIPFCTSDQAFTIEGDDKCEERGFATTFFRKIDTGKTATRFTANLGAFLQPGHSAGPAAHAPRVEPGGAAAEPPPAPPAGGLAPGSFGEPWQGRAVVQGCEVVDGYDHCAFYADGMKFMVPRGGPSDRVAQAILQAQDPGVPLQVTGDITAFFDSSVEFALSSAEPAGYTEFDVMRHDLQGHWYAVDDPASQFTVLGAERYWTYDGVPSMTDSFRLTTRCNGRSRGGPYIASRDPEIGDTLCYSIEHLDGLRLVVMYVENGNILEYRKLD